MRDNPDSPEYRPLPDLDRGDVVADGESAASAEEAAWRRHGIDLIGPEHQRVSMDAPVTDGQIRAAIRAFLAVPSGYELDIAINDPDNATDPGFWSTATLTGYWYVDGQNPDGTPNIDIAITGEYEDAE